MPRSVHTFRFDDDLWQKFKVRCVELKLDMADVLEQATIREITRLGIKPGDKK